MLYPLSYEGGSATSRVAATCHRECHVARAAHVTRPTGTKRLGWRRHTGPFMADPLHVLAARLQPAFDAVAGAPASTRSCGRPTAPTPRPTARSPLAKAARPQPARRRPGGRRRRRPRRRRDRRDRRAGVRQPHARPVVHRRARRRRRRRRSPRHRAGRRAGAGRRRLLGAERRQGDAHRPPPHDGDRRRPGAHARAPSATTSSARTTSATGAGRSGCSSSTSSTSAPSAPSRSASATSTPSTRRRTTKFDAGRGLPGAGPARGSCCCSSGDAETMRAVARCSSTRAPTHWNEVYAKLGVLLTDDDLAGESRYEALMPEVIERLDAAGLLEESDGAEVVFPPGFTNREGEPLPLIVRSRAGAFTYATSDLACVVDRVERVGATRLLYVVGAEQAQHFAMVFAVAAMAGWLVPPARAEHVVVRPRARRPTASGCKSRSGEPVRFIDVIDEAIERGMAAVAEKNPDLPAEQRERGRPRRRHRRAQVRRPVDRPDPRLRLRLGPDAVVRRQHGAVPAVRPRPDLLDLPAGRRRAGRRAGDGADARRAAGAGAGDARARLRHRRRRDGRAGRARTGCARTCTSWRRTSRRSTSTARCSRPRMPAPGRVAWR